jgi:hypothetical protein
MTFKPGPFYSRRIAQLTITWGAERAQNLSGRCREQNILCRVSKHDSSVIQPVTYHLSSIENSVSTERKG